MTIKPAPIISVDDDVVYVETYSHHAEIRRNVWTECGAVTYLEIDDVYVAGGWT